MLLLYEKNNKEQQIGKKIPREISRTRSIFIGKNHLQLFQVYNFLTLFHISINYMLTQKIRWLSNNFHRPERRRKKKALKVRIKCEYEFDTKSSKTTNIHASKKQNSSSEDRVSMPQQSWWLRLDNTSKRCIIENSVNFHTYNNKHKDRRHYWMNEYS